MESVDFPVPPFWLAKVIVHTAFRFRGCRSSRGESPDTITSSHRRVLTKSKAAGTRRSRCRVGRVGSDRGADRASNDADVCSIRPIIPYGGFSPVTAGRLAIQAGRLPEASIARSRSRHALTDDGLSSTLRALRGDDDSPALCRAARTRCTAVVGDYPTAPEALAKVRVVLSRSSSLNRPHPWPEPEALAISPHGGVSAIAFAVRERRGAPDERFRAFTARFLRGMPSFRRGRTDPAAATVVSRSNRLQTNAIVLAIGSKLPRNRQGRLTHAARRPRRRPPCFQKAARKFDRHRATAEISVWRTAIDGSRYAWIVVDALRTRLVETRLSVRYATWALSRNRRESGGLVDEEGTDTSLGSDASFRKLTDRYIDAVHDFAEGQIHVLWDSGGSSVAL